MHTRRYAGIGSRETPPEVLEVMQVCAAKLALAGWELHSGGADGADSAFELGANESRGAKQIHLPWQGFNNNRSPLYGVTPEALKLAASLHPAWHKISQGAQKLMARNCYQILGRELNAPCAFVLCWTPTGGPTGGTGQALRLAEKHNIPVFNLKKHSLGSFLSWLSQYESTHP